MNEKVELFFFGRFFHTHAHHTLQFTRAEGAASLRMTKWKNG